MAFSANSTAAPGFHLPADAPWDWQMLWDSACNISEAVPPLVVHAYSKGLRPCDLFAIELAGELPGEAYPILKFGSDQPNVSYWFSPQGAFQHTRFA